MKGKKVLHGKGKRDDWGTPLEDWDRWNLCCCFGFDVAASKKNALCKHYWTEKDDALKQDWFKAFDDHGTLWCNPPYSKWQKFVEKAHGAFSPLEGLRVACVMLLPSRTDTKAFHEYLWNQHNVSLKFIKGRLKFQGAEHGAPFPSLLAYFYA